MLTFCPSPPLTSGHDLLISTSIFGLGVKSAGLCSLPDLGSEKLVALDPLGWAHSGWLDPSWFWNSDGLSEFADRLDVRREKALPVFLVIGWTLVHGQIHFPWGWKFCLHLRESWQKALNFFGLLGGGFCLLLYSSFPEWVDNFLLRLGLEIGFVSENFGSGRSLVLGSLVIEWIVASLGDVLGL